MSDFQPEPPPVRRGRRDPELAAQLGLENNELEAGVDDDAEQEMPLLFEGDVLGRKVTLDVVIDGRSQWIQSEARTRVYPGEPPESTSERLTIVVRHDLEEQIEEAEAVLIEYAKARKARRIAPQ